MEPQGRIKVAILGGGPGAMSAALALTRTEEGRERYEVTVYQQGWRLGGKCASGREIPEMRILEHGLHMLLGFYDTTFEVMRGCYQEWRRPHRAFATFDDAVEPQNQVTLQERVGESGAWHSWDVTVPVQPGRPGDTGADNGLGSPPAALDLTHDLLEWTARRHRRLKIDAARLPGLRSLRHRLQEADLMLASAWRRVRKPLAIERAHKLAHQARRKTGTGRQGASRRGAEAPRPAPWPARDGAASNGPEIVRLHGLSAGLLPKLLKLIASGKAELDALVPLAKEDVRHDVLLLRLAYAMLSGLVRDVLMQGGDFSRINNLDFRAWLQKHGASKQDAWSAPIKAFYDLGFAYVDGVTDEAHAQAAAGVALYVSLRMMFTCSGALLWKMKAGAGDTLFAPIYEVLKERGVRFKFFHRVESLALSADKHHIEAVRVNVQAAVKNGGEYEPLTDVPYGDSAANRIVPSWLAEPHWQQIEDGPLIKQRLHDMGITFESFSCTETRQKLTLKRGTDFDVVVMGISVGALPFICKELVDARPAWGRMVEEIKTVQTESLQLWMRPTLEELGWRAGPTVSIAYVEPLDSWAVMSHLVPAEAWRKGEKPGSIQYFCSAMPNTIGDVLSPDQASRELHVAETDAATFLGSAIGHLWPRAVKRDGSFDSSLVLKRYVRANFDPSERYVLSVPGTIAARLRPDCSTFANLYLAGDWVLGDINSGALESAMQSGIHAAEGIKKVRWQADYLQPGIPTLSSLRTAK